MTIDTRSWPSFAERLAAELGTLATSAATAILIVSARTDPDAFVQFSAGGDGPGVWAEAAGNDHRPKERRLAKADEERLRAAGWSKPSRWHRIPNWHTARFADSPADGYGPLADLTVTTLRDVMGIASPADLRYTAFEHLSGDPIELPALELARGEPPAGPAGQDRPQTERRVLP